MKQAKDDPEGVADVALATRSETDQFGGSYGLSDSPYTVDGYRAEIKKLRRKVARLQNLLRLAETFSTEARVKTILQEALEV